MRAFLPDTASLLVSTPLRYIFKLLPSYTHAAWFQLVLAIYEITVRCSGTVSHSPNYSYLNRHSRFHMKYATSICGYFFHNEIMDRLLTRYAEVSFVHIFNIYAPLKYIFPNIYFLFCHISYTIVRKSRIVYGFHKCIIYSNPASNENTRQRIADNALHTG